ncbi:MAG: helix-turn-helix domain-containing protein [Planctomycetota bacterium]|jgi:DNA-binding IclR family transcriptional regulator
MKPKAAVPALDNALTILEYIISSKSETGYKEIVDKTGIPRASVSRIMQVFKDRGYILSNETTNKYQAGPKITVFGKNTRLISTLKEISTPVLNDLSRKLSDSTVLLFIPWGLQLFTVTKIQPENALSMIGEGKLVTDIGKNPWGWIYYYSLSEQLQKEAMQYIESAKYLKRNNTKHKVFYEKNSFTYDDCLVHQNKRRLAAPVYHENQLIAIIGTGAGRLEYSDDKVTSVGKTLLKFSNKLSERI